MELAIRRFDFEGLQDFRAPIAPIEIAVDHTLPKEAEEIAPPAPPSFSQSELEAAKKAAFEEGRLAGEKQERERSDAQTKAREEAVLSAVHSMCKQAAQMHQDLADFKAKQTSELSGLLRMLVEKIAGDALSQAPHSAIEAMIDECLCVLQAEPKVVIQVHPECFTAIEAKLRELTAQHRLATKVMLQENAELGLSDARMGWASGEAQRSLRDMWQQVETLIEAIDFTKLATQEEPQKQPQDSMSEPALNASHREGQELEAKDKHNKGDEE